MSEDSQVNEGTTERLVNAEIEALVRSRQRQLGLFSHENLPIVLAHLSATFTSTDPIAQIAAASPMQISRATNFILEGDGAEVLIDAAKRELAARPAPAAADTRPLEELNFEELMVRAVADPDNEAVIRAINSLDEVKKALRKAREWAMLVNGQLDLAHTKLHLEWLARPETSFRPFFERGGVKGMAVTLLRAIGQEKKVRYVHPLNDNAALVDGRDDDFDWSPLLANETRYRALVWARRTNHRFWPAGMDAFTLHEQMTAETLGRRWQTIVEEYEAAKAALQKGQELNDEIVWVDTRAGLMRALAELREAVQDIPERPQVWRPSPQDLIDKGYVERRAQLPDAQPLILYSDSRGDVDAGGRNVEVRGDIGGRIYNAATVNVSSNRRVGGSISADTVIVHASASVGGNIEAGTMCTVDQGASVGGDVQAATAHIYGSVGGDVQASEVLISRTGRVGGDVQAGVVNNSGYINGDVMSGSLSNSGRINGDVMGGF